MAAVFPTANRMIEQSMSYSCWIAVLLGIAALAGCGAPPSPADVDPAFQDAIVQYLRANNMAMKIKEIKRGPEISGETAKLSASLVHEQLAGPSVTWEFDFAKASDGKWQVTQHKD
jgi:hypothetical protein